MGPKFRLYTAVFICGAATMVLELVGSRLLAPFLGTSIIIWASLIGVILASLSFGYWLGGRWADRSPSAVNLSAAILFAGLYIGLMAFAELRILAFVTVVPLDLRLKALLGVFVLFFPPNVALGMVSPMTMRLTLQDAKDSGKASGTISALSTVGSITGTFLAGFVLMSVLGSTRVLFLVAASLVFVSLLVSLPSLKKTKAISLLFLLLLGSPNFAERAFSAAGVTNIDTAYSRVTIYDFPEFGIGRKVRVLSTGAFPRGSQGLHLLTQSKIYLDAPGDLSTSYLKAFRIAEHFNPKIERGLLIGGGAFTFAGDFIQRNDSAQLDVVEIDPELLGIARQYFGFKDDPRISVFHEDGRPFIARAEGRYDAVYVDAFSSAGTMAYNLTTQEAVEDIFEHLDDDGVAVVNIISSLEGDTGKLLRAELRTYRSVFPLVLVLPVADPADPKAVQNIVLVALKSRKEFSRTSSDQEMQKYLDNLWQGEVPQDMPILTDDFAPVDQYTIPIYFEG